MTQKLVIVCLSLAIILLLYRIFVTPPVTPVVVDKSREKELLDSLAIVHAENNTLATQAKKLVDSHAREKVAYKRSDEAKTAEIRRLRSLIPNHVEQDTAFLNYEAAMKSQRVADSTRIENLEVTVDSLGEISGKALTNLVIASKIHQQLLNQKQVELQVSKAETKKERRKKVLSQIGGVVAVVVTVLVLK